MRDGPALGFEQAWSAADRVPGWLTREQARALWDAVLQLPPEASVLEIGSHQGRSTVVLGAAARRVGADVIAVDPFVEGRMFGGGETRQRFEQHIADADLTDVVELIPDYSTRLRPTWNRPIRLLYIDGKHDYWTCRDDLRWTRFLPVGAHVLVHDAFSSVGVTSALVVDALLLGRVRYVGRTGSLARLTAERAGRMDRLAVVAQLGWFVRNVAVKVLLRLRLTPLTRLLGHRGGIDPF